MRGSCKANRPNWFLDTAMGFRRSAGALENIRFGGVKGGEISLAGCNIRDFGLGNRLRIPQNAARFFEIIGRLGLHISMPSIRSSCIKPVRSLSAPAGNGMADTSASIASRISVVIAASRCNSSRSVP